MCIKNLNNGRLQKDHFGQKMTLDNTQQDIFGSQAHIFEIFYAHENSFFHYIFLSQLANKQLFQNGQANVHITIYVIHFCINPKLWKELIWLFYEHNIYDFFFKRIGII